MKRTYQAIKDLVGQSKTAIIVCHIDPDGDTLGSMLAMGEILEKMGLDVELFSQDGVPNTYKFLPGSERIISHPPKKEFDVMITVDASDLKRTGLPNIHAKKIINIDHHPDNTNFGDVNYVELLSSVAELVYKIAKEFDVPITEQMAISLYTSIITDTGNFRYSNTLPSTFEIARKLVEHGANPYKIANLIYETRSLESVKILALVLSSIEHTPDKKVVWASISKELLHKVQAKSEDLVGIIDHIRSIKECEVALLFREEKNGMIKVNFRSKGKVNVSEIAGKLGGGGHMQASGCELVPPMDDAKKKVLDLVLKEAS